LRTPQERANCFAELLDGIHQVPNDPNFNATFFDQIANNVLAFKNIPHIDPLPHPLHDEHLTDELTTDEVKTIISLLKNTKAPGPDQIRPILLKNLPDSAFQALTDIFNNCMNNLYFPTAWKTAHTVMIPKPGKCPNDPESYRPISLLSITGKIFEIILTNRLQFTLESNNLLPPEQFSFRAQRSTYNPLAELQTDITRHANLGECTVGVFLDIERAFDKVWHDGLVQKLLNLHLNLKFIKLISSSNTEPSFIQHSQNEQHSKFIHSNGTFSATCSDSTGNTHPTHSMTSLKQHGSPSASRYSKHATLNAYLTATTP
jgi:hypothetical protein